MSKKKRKQFKINTAKVVEYFLARKPLSHWNKGGGKTHTDGNTLYADGKPIAYFDDVYHLHIGMNGMAYQRVGYSLNCIPEVDLTNFQEYVPVKERTGRLTGKYQANILRLHGEKWNGEWVKITV